MTTDQEIIKLAPANVIMQMSADAKKLEWDRNSTLPHYVQYVREDLFHALQAESERLKSECAELRKDKETLAQHITYLADCNNKMGVELMFAATKLSVIAKEGS